MELYTPKLIDGDPETCELAQIEDLELTEEQAENCRNCERVATCPAWAFSEE